MIKVKFAWREDEQLGGFGWIPVDQPNFNASTGRGVAHDTMEHFDLTDGSVKGELLAFGSILYTRGEGGWFWRQFNPNIAWHMGSSLVSVFRDAFHNGERIEVPKCHVKPLDSCMEDEIQPAIDECMKQLLSEFRHDEYRPDAAWYASVRKAMRGWIRRGYRKAVRRYHNADAWRLTELYGDIARKVDLIGECEVGDILTVQISRKSLEFKATVEYPEDAYA